MKKQISFYFTAQVNRELCWLISAVFRGTENVAFDRALDKEDGLFEFFVPADMEPVFQEMMAYLKAQGAVLTVEQKENRLLTDTI